MNPELDPGRALGPDGLFATRWPGFEYRPTGGKETIRSQSAAGV